MRKCLLWLKGKFNTRKLLVHDTSIGLRKFKVQAGLSGRSGRPSNFQSLLPFYLPTTPFLGLFISCAISCVYCLSFLWRLRVQVETAREVGILQRGLHQHDFRAHFLTRRPLSKLRVFSLFVGQTTSAFVAGFHLLLLPLYLECIVYFLSAHK